MENRIEVVLSGEIADEAVVQDVARVRFMALGLQRRLDFVKIQGDDLHIPHLSVPLNQTMANFPVGAGY
jgi:hypothetical protein